MIKDPGDTFDKPCWQEGTGCPVKTAFELKEQTKIIHEHIYGGKTVFEEIIATPIFDDQGEVAFVIEELNDANELIQSKEISAHLKKEMKILHGLLPICAKCKKIRDEKGYWNQIESYISNHSEIQFSHGLCEACIDDKGRSNIFFILVFVSSRIIASRELNPFEKIVLKHMKPIKLKHH